MKKVVVLGGGTGLSVLLKGLKEFPVDITAIVTVSDDGRSTGRLRSEFNTPAVGDLRNVLASLSKEEPLVEELLQYRFQTSSDLNNHALGNLLLTALYNITGNLTKSMESLGRILNIKGRILPLTEDKATLIAHTKDNETIIGESNITKAGKVITKLEYQKEIKVTKEVKKAIKEADLIIFGIGSLYTSILPNIINSEIRQCLISSKGKKMYICNAMTEHGETDNFKVSDCIKTINNYIKDNFIEVVIANSKKIDNKIKKIYKEKEYSTPIEIDSENIKKLNVELISDELIVIKNNQVRHNSLKTAFLIFSYLMNGE